MDIVHLIETKLIKSSAEETSSRTYAEIEQTIALDHSEGNPARGGFQLVGESLRRSRAFLWTQPGSNMANANANPNLTPLAPRQVSLPFTKTSTVPGPTDAPSPSTSQDQAGRYP